MSVPAFHVEAKLHGFRRTADGVVVSSCQLCGGECKALGRRFCSRACAIRHRCCRSYAERLELHSALNPETGCVEWTGSRSPKGYGQTGIPGLRGAHRLAYFVANGPIPEGMQVLHRCDNPPCVTEGHLFLGTNDDNVRDKIQKGRATPVIGEAQGRAKLTDEIVRNIRRSPLSNAELARQYGVAKPVLRRARIGETWKHVQ